MGPPAFFNPALALVDFQRSLSSCGSPNYPERRWWSCLVRTEELDDLRRRTAAQLALDAAEYYAPQVVHREWLGNSSSAKMNGTVLYQATTEPEIWRANERRRAS